jgi:hypothetical protein
VMRWQFWQLSGEVDFLRTTETSSVGLLR